MTTRIGMDPGAVRGLADQLDHLGDDLTNLIGRVNGAVNRLGHTWHGEDFQQFAHTWHSRNAATITHVISELRQMATTAKQNAAEQEQASRPAGDASGWTAERIESTAIDGVGLGLTVGGLSITAVQLERLSHEIGVPLKDLKVGELGDLETVSKLANLGHYLSVVGAGVDVAKVGIDFHDGANPWGTLYDIAHAGIDVLAPDNPYVAAWDVGTTIGTAIADSPAGQHVQYEALNVGASYIHGDPYTDPTAANDLVKRYNGAGGFFNAMHDSVAGMFH
jgi:WXG100 family type VII secretion target